MVSHLDTSVKKTMESISSSFAFLEIHYWRRVQCTYLTELQKFYGSVVEATCRLNDPEIQKLNLDALLALMPYRRFSSWLSIRLTFRGRKTDLLTLLALGLDTNITKNRLNMFAEIPDFFSKYLESVLNISKLSGLIS